MKYLLVMLAFPAMFGKGCKDKTVNTEDTATSVPACVQKRIDSIQQLPRWNPPAEVNEYSYKGKKVYLFSSDCCDFVNPLIDENCSYVCAPHGGITGKGDFKCPDFDSLAKHVRVVWKDKREK